MTVATPFSSDTSEATGYRFGQAELQLASERLLVAGEEMPLSPMAYRFLLGLCRASDALLTRSQAFDLLWPGGGNGSDEALAQIVAKVRRALGPESDSLITLRSRGFRIDRPVEPICPLVICMDLDNAVEQSQPTALPMQEPQRLAALLASGKIRANSRWRIFFWTVALFVAIAVVVAAASSPSTAPQKAVLDGYAVSAEKFGPISVDGARKLHEILARDDEGDRTSALHMLEGLAESEPHSAAAPFFLRYLGASTLAPEQGRHWRQALEELLPTNSSPYLQLMSRWVRIDGDEPGVEFELLNTALKLEPTAWRLHLARAHVALRLSHFDTALADLRAIPLEHLVPRYAMFVMSDRASLGDADAMQAELAALALRAPVVADYVRGRIAAARGQSDVAQAAYEAAAELAEHDGLFGSFSQAWLLAAIAAGDQGQWDRMAQDTERALRLGIEHSQPYLVAESETMLGYAHYRRAHASESAAAWERAGAEFEKVDKSTAGIRLWLLRARIDPAWGSAHSPQTTDRAAIEQGLDALVSARRSWLACRADDAASALTAADVTDIDAGYFGDEADLLRQDLGLPRRAAVTPPQLPYPMPARWISYWESAREAGIRSCAPAK